VSKQASNPLLNLGYPFPFGEITPEHMVPAVKKLVQLCNQRLRAIAGSQQPRTFENTLGALDTLTREIDQAMTVIAHLKETASSPEIRAAHSQAEPLVIALHSRILLHTGLWKALQEFAASPDAAALSGPRRRYLNKTMAAFRRNGAALPLHKKRALRKIDLELGRVASAFSDNVLDSTNAYEWVVENEQELAGLPSSARSMARDAAAAKGITGWRFTLQAPSYEAIMEHLDDRSVRERFYRAYHSRASLPPFDNGVNIARIIELRRAKASLLGYADFAELVIEERMAKSGKAASEFLDRLRVQTGPAFQRENTELEEIAPHPVEAWDVLYYAEKLRKARFDLDEEALRPYFPLDRVVNGMFQIAGRLFGIRVEERTGVPAWHPSVRFYEIFDGKDLLGGFYTDWFPRENKRPGAWMDGMLTGSPVRDGFTPHLGLMCGNLTPPTGGRPALLTHRDVETVFHEFGHLLHHLLSRVELRSQSGTAVAWDFVELPSQIMENWCWEREALDLFAAHYETGDPLPEDLFQRMRKAQTFRAANQQMRQLSFGIMDLALHRSYDPARDGGILAYCRQVQQALSPAPLPEDFAMVNSFSHLFGSPVGYAAGYYSYKWAEVLDADAFKVFLKAGIFDATTGARFRSAILSRGDSEDPAQLYRDFAGRDPDTAALLERAGLLQTV